MKLGIMQPYFLPYIGYFQLINTVDEFILFDTPQFIRHGWIDRNRVLKLNGETFYIKVPLVKHKRETRINKIIINNRIDWKAKLFAQLTHYKRSAKYYSCVVQLLESIFQKEYNSIIDLNYNSLLEICKYLEINTQIWIWSKMEIKIDAVKAPDEWALNICKKIKANKYYNLPGGKSFFNKNKYEDESIELKFLESELINYKQFNNEFVPWLSIIDVLMFNNKEEVKKMLYQFKLQ